MSGTFKVTSVETFVGPDEETAMIQIGTDAGTYQIQVDVGDTLEQLAAYLIHKGKEIQANIDRAKEVKSDVD